MEQTTACAQRDPISLTFFKAEGKVGRTKSEVVSAGPKKMVAAKKNAVLCHQSGLTFIS